MRCSMFDRLCVSKCTIRSTGIVLNIMSKVFDQLNSIGLGQATPSRSEQPDQGMHCL